MRKILSRFVNSKINQLLSQVTLLAVTAYFVVTKISDFSVEEKLSHFFKQPAVDLISNILIIIVFYCFVIKIVKLVLDFFPSFSINSHDPKSLTMLHLSFNKEIIRHLNTFSPNYFRDSSEKLSNAHAFETNIALVTDHLFNHLLSGVEQCKIKKRDLFISIYKIENFETGETAETKSILKYLTHSDLSRDLVKSKDIDFESKKHKNYECVKCCINDDNIVVQMSNGSYRKTGNKRSKLVKLYIGMSIRTGDDIVGFINIEFHRNSPFSSEDDVIEYIESDLLSFKYLIEYQFLKKKFFTTLDQGRIL